VLKYTLFNRLSGFLIDNRNLILLCVVTSLFSLFRPRVLSFILYVDNISILQGVLIYIVLGLLLLPTSPLNILYGAIFGPLATSFMVATSTTIIILLQYYLLSSQTLIPISTSSITAHLRASPIPLPVKLLIIRLNPILPLQITVSLLRGKRFTAIQLLFAITIIFAATLPASLVLSLPLNKTFTSSFLLSPLTLIFSVLILSIPSLFISSRLKCTILVFFNSILFFVFNRKGKRI